MNHICCNALLCVALGTQAAAGQIRADSYAIEHELDADAFAFSPNGQSVAVAVGQALQIVAIGTGKVEASLKLEAPPNAKWIRSLSFSGDGTRVAIAYGVGNVDVYDARDLAQVSSFKPAPADCFSVVVSPNLSHIAIGGRHDVSVWDLAKSTMVTTIKSDHDYVWALAFSPDGQYVASTSPRSANWVKMWNISERKTAVRLEGTGLYQHRYQDAGVDKTIMLPRNRCSWWFVEFSPDGQKLVAVGRRIASGSESSPATVIGVITVWRVLDGRRLWQYETPDTTFQAAAIHPTVDGLVVAGGRTGSGRDAKPVASIVDLKLGIEITTLAGLRDEVQGVRFSDTGDRLATITSGGKVLIWEHMKRDERR